MTKTQVIEDFIKDVYEELKILLLDIYTESGVTEGLAAQLAEQRAEQWLNRIIAIQEAKLNPGGKMNLVQLREEIGNDEGRIEKIYKDHLGYPTFGIGHLITENDPEHGLPIGSIISAERVNEAFDADVANVLHDCETLYPDFYEKPEEVQLIVANMMFNMGLTRLSKFKNMKKAVDDEEWSHAANEMRNSRWYRQVTNRAERLAKRMENV